ncbi:MAG TPA: BatD family protein [Thermoanaerobaculia bacterium]|nr:BatD family protein [Thermoanaerobaculia bacterium]
MKRAAFLFAAAALAAPFARAADELSVQVLVDKARPAADDVVRLTYSFSGSGLGGALRLPASLPLKNLVLAGGPSKSDQMSFVNGVFSHSLSLTYFLRPQGPGPAEIGEVSFNFDEKTVKAASYMLEVGPARGRGAQSVEPQEDDPLSQLFRRRDVSAGRSVGPGAAAQARPLIEFRVTPDKTTAYVGEEITLHYELLTQADVQGLEYLEPPRFPGCWAEDLEKPEKPVGHRDVVDGRTVMRFTLLKKLVSGLNPGTVNIPEARIRTSVRVSADPFGDAFGFFPRPQVMDLVARALTLRILPIPGDAAFRGPVGRFDLSAKLDRPRVAPGEAVTLRIRLSGTGNLRTATESPRVDIANVMLYPPSVKSDSSRAGRTQVATEWSYVLVPKEHGTVTIPPVSLAVFDPAEKRIVTKTTVPLTLVAEGTSATGTAASLTTAETTLPTPTAPVPPSAPRTAARSGFQAGVDFSRNTVTLPFWAIAAVPGAALLALGAVFATRRRRTRAAWREAMQPEPDETKERAAARVDRALREVLARRYLVAEGASAPDVLSSLAERGLPAAQIDEVRALLCDVDFLRYAPQLGDYEARIAELRGRAARVLPRLA